MPERDPCVLCETRPPRRRCPGVNGEICAVCCATEREQTINCPLDCEYLRESRRHEKLPELDPKTMPAQEIPLSDSFVHEKEPLIIATGRILLAASLQTPGAVDSDVRDALEALVRTFKTAESGLIYTTRPSNMVAAQIQERFSAELEVLRQQVAQRTGLHSIRDADILAVLVFWLRMLWRNENGKPKGRAFIGSLLEFGEIVAGGEPRSTISPAGI